MKIEIIVTSFNNGAYLTKCIESLKQQTFEEFSVIVVDDNSLENTLPYASKVIGEDQRFKLSRNKKNRGSVEIFTKYARLTQAKYIMWLHHDDWLHPEFLEKTYSALESDQSCTFAYSLISRVLNGRSCEEFPSAIRPDLPTGSHDISYDTAINCWIMFSSALIRTEAYQRSGGLEYFVAKYRHRKNVPILRRGEPDLYLFAKLASLGRVYVINERLCHYRYHLESNTSLLKKFHIQDNLRTYDIIFDEVEFFSEEIRIVCKINSISRLATACSFSDVAYQFLYKSKISREFEHIRRRVIKNLLIVLSRFIRDDQSRGYPHEFDQKELSFLASILENNEN